MTSSGLPALRSAVIGAGAISLQHLDFLRSSSRSRLVGICDLSPVSSGIAARRFDAEDSFTDVATMLEQARPDVVHVLTPPNTHGFLATMCLERGVHVICEKPMSPTSSEAAELLAVAAKHGVHLVENHNYRFNDEILELQKVVAAGTIGDVHEVDIRMALPIRDEGSRFADENLPNPIHDMPAGVIHDFITHFAYLMNTLSGEATYERVAAVWSNHGGGDLFRFDDLDALLVGHNATGPFHGRLRFSCSTKPDLFSVVVRGSGGQAATDLFHPFLEVVGPRPGGEQLTPIVNHIVNGTKLARSGFKNFGQKLLQHGPYHGLAKFLDDTYAAFQNGQAPPVSPAQILAAAQLVDQLLEAEASR